MNRDDLYKQILLIQSELHEIWKHNSYTEDGLKRINNIISETIQVELQINDIYNVETI